ncbi:MAG: alcohol dehydrogenase catalytic domain-containing protein [candidate division Zixibacteria bacterium]|nr:alcohol dehydrogenase catalytic domain-containing protein [candidate division Zixibacteria bacterium]
MKALVKTAKGRDFIELKEAPRPDINAKEVLIAVKFAGVCTTDIHIQHDRFPYWPPVIMGHEFSGEIVEIGEEVKDWKIGDRIVGEPHTMACGECFLCRTGNIQICEHKRSPGWGIDGAFAEFLRMPKHLLHKIPENVTFEEAALAEPTAVVVYEVLERSRVEPGDFVVIIGPGPLGLLSTMLCKASGASRVAVIGTGSAEEIRFSIARQVGADHIINTSQEDPIDVIARLSEGRGADLVVETSGSPSGINCAVETVRKLGRITSIGFAAEDQVPLPWNKAMYKNCEITFTMSSSYSSWGRALALIDGRIDVKPVITDILSIEEWKEAFERVAARKRGKVLFKF